MTRIQLTYPRECTVNYPALSYKDYPQVNWSAKTLYDILLGSPSTIVTARRTCIDTFGTQIYVHLIAAKEFSYYVDYLRLQSSAVRSLIAQKKLRCIASGMNEPPTFYNYLVVDESQ